MDFDEINCYNNGILKQLNNAPKILLQVTNCYGVRPDYHVFTNGIHVVLIINLTMLLILLFITRGAADSERADCTFYDNCTSCATVTWESNKYAKLDYEDSLPPACAQGSDGLVFMDEMGNAFCLEAEPEEEKTSTIECDKFRKNLRLTDHILPSHYDIRLDIFMEKHSTDGLVKIRFNVVKPTKQIVLHTNYECLEILEVNITQGNLKDKEIAVEYQLQDKEREQLTLVLEEEAEPSMKEEDVFTLAITFTGKIANDSQKGLFAAEDNKLGMTAATQFSATHARKAFPCFDEPALKATFSITLGRSKEFHTVSNTRTMKKQKRDNGLYWDHYEVKLCVKTKVPNPN